ncbi:uncharacterized protein LOC124160927 [Ischnura elegans]|uniref:uncharacterized protein LOC124160927 n=1 Tax=Ischnura elegans TaxID=197161 RepID=UPI001ED8706C|nr:uncharacterized protein LOC124160927 [Ischnura elegans]
MSLRRTNAYKLLRDRLVGIDYAEAISWRGEDLAELLNAKTSRLSIIKWLLEQLSGDTISNDPAEVSNCVLQYVVGLGIRKSSQAANLISGKASADEQIEFLSTLITLVNCKRNDEENKENINIGANVRHLLGQMQEVLGAGSDINEYHSQANARKKSTTTTGLNEGIKSVDYYAEENAILKSRVEQAKEKCKRMRKDLGLKDGEVARDYINRISQKREELNEKAANLVQSLLPLSKQVKNIFENELSSLMPIDVADPVDLPVIDSLYEKVEFISQMQGAKRTLKICASSLMKKSLGESPGDNWSTRKMSTLPILQLNENAHSAVND